MEHKDILAKFKEAEDYHKQDYERNKEDYEFAFGDQWPENIKNDRESEGRPCLTENRLLPFINQVVNNIRQTRPSVVIKPVDSGADIETAEVLEGLIRNIQNTNDAESVYDTASFNAVAGGLGWIRLGTAYCDDVTFDQEVTIDRILNPYSVMLDPRSQRQDGSDAEFAFVHEDMSREAFEEAYPDAETDNVDNTGKEWFDKDNVRIAEYFYKDYEDKTLVQYTVTIAGQEVETIGYEDTVPEDAEIIDERKVRICTVKHCKISGAEILEENDFPSSYIPLVPVLGLEAWIDDKRRVYTLIHQAKDPQMMFNFWKTASAEVIALQPKAPWIIAAGQVKGYESTWANANRVNTAFLPYTPISKDGLMVPPPQRQMPPTSSGSMMQEAMAAADGIKASTGMYDASMGNNTPDVSGKAIISRQVQGDNANFHFIDNLSTAMKQVGRIMVDMIPRLYTGKRIVRILGQDGEDKLVPLNQPVIKQGTDYVPDNGQGDMTKAFQLEAGKYDVVVEVGPAYATKRQEAANSIVELMKADPNISAVALDLLVKNLDIPESETLVKRIRATMSPELLEDDVDAQRLIQLTEQLNILQEKLGQTELALQVKQDDQKFKNDLELMKIENDRKDLEIKAMKTVADIEKIQAEIQEQIPAEAFKDIADAVNNLQGQFDDVSGAVDVFLSAEEGKATFTPEVDATKE